MGENKRMTNIDMIKSMSMEEFSKWLDSYIDSSSVPWSMEFSKSFCDKCDGIKVTLTYGGMERESECNYCELNDGTCKFFPEKGELKYADMIKWWLEQESSL